VNEMDDRFLLFGLESFNELLNQALPKSVNWESSLMKITSSGLDENKMIMLIGQFAKIMMEPIEGLDDEMKYHIKKQVSYALEKKLVIKSDLTGELTIELLKEEPHLKISKSTPEDLSKLPVITINKDALLSVLGGKATMLEMILKKQMVITQPVLLADALTRLLLAIPALYLTNRDLLNKLQIGLQQFLTQFN